MSPTPDLHDSILSAWRTSNRVTVELLEHLPAPLWSAEVPGMPRRTIRMIAAHLHNSRCSWIRTLGREHGVTTPARVDRYAVTPRQLSAALKRSSRGMEELLELGFADAIRKEHAWRTARGESTRNLDAFAHLIGKAGKGAE